MSRITGSLPAGRRESLVFGEADRRLNGSGRFIRILRPPADQLESTVRLTFSSAAEKRRPGAVEFRLCRSPKVSTDMSSGTRKPMSRSPEITAQ